LINEARSGFRWQRARIPILVIVLGGLYIFAQQSGILEDADPHKIRSIVQQWGLYGILLYVVLFSVGLLLYIPGTLFIIAAGLAYGNVWGIAVALLGANVAVNLSFYFVRLIGGSPFESHRHPLVEKLLRTLHSSPVVNISIMRFVLGTSSGLNYLLALSAVKPRQHFLGSLMGMIVPVATVAYLSDWLIVNVF
jgi:uncharacterized membrane protein YdjX (TVP38/TMEM64 family)